jgi:hypothetical protein
MKSETTSWNKAAVFICTKCFKGTDTADKLKMDWKMRLKERGLGSQVRVMTSGCLDECPVDQQSILIAEKNGKQEVIVCNPHAEREEVFEKILKIAEGK